MKAGCGRHSEMGEGGFLQMTVRSALDCLIHPSFSLLDCLYESTYVLSGILFPELEIISHASPDQYVYVERVNRCLSNS